MSDKQFFQVNETDLDYLKKEWLALASAYQKDKSVSENLFREIREKYSARERAYHNLSHIKVLLERAESFEDRIQNYPALCFAIWFHDLIYNSKKNDNEEKSAEFARERLTQLGVDVTTRELARDLILATKQHQVNDQSEDKKIFLDLDLAILGVSGEIYQEYSKAIRKEYSWVPFFLYRRSRKKVLNNFLMRDRLYFTDEMAAKLEQPARRNLAEEIKTL